MRRSDGGDARGSRRVLAWVAIALSLQGAGCRAKKTEVTPRGPATRVVSISASTTEAIFAVGAGDRAVGRSRYCDYPPEALRLPAVGGFTDPSLEAILALRPDLVVGARGPLGPGIVRTLEERGVATYFPETETVDGIFSMVEGLAARVGHAADGSRIAARLRRRRDAFIAAVAPLPHPRVVLLFAKRPIAVAGRGSFADEMLRLAGATNAVDKTIAYPTLALEDVIAIDPEIILDAEMGGVEAPMDATWSSVRAVREGKVVRIRDEVVLRPGPRVLDGVAVIARAIHPDAPLP